MLAKIIAVLIFLIMFLFIILDKFPRHYITLISGAATIIFVFGLCMHSPSAIMASLNLDAFFHTSFWWTHAAEESVGINWSTIIFIGGMMIMVEGMSLVGFFRWLCMWIAKLVNYQRTALFISFMIMSALLAMFIDSITVILFLVAVTIELSQLLKFNPVPMVLGEIFCANLGGSATMCGDPPNIIIGTSLGYGFFDFLTNTGVAALLGLIASIIYFYLMNRKYLRQPFKVDTSQVPTPKSAIVDYSGFIKSTIIFIIAVVLLISHSATGLTVSTIGIIIGALTIICAGKTHALEILKKVDYITLLFFIGLFVVVSGLEETGVLEAIASFIGKVCNGNPLLIVTVIIWVSGVASAFVDNIPFAATMLPVIKALASSSTASLPTLAWALSLGCDIGGSATPIGASANVVGISEAEHSGFEITWGKYLKTSLGATIIVLLISNWYIIARYFL
ncbi:MAG: anion permease [Lachnospiraceae bacterium]|nr:anion permease [Lachnospiraceae bacterium]